MIYIATVKYYDDFDDKRVTSFMFIAANSTSKAVEQLDDFFGENNLLDVTISAFSPDNFLEINEEFDELFHDFALHAGDNVVW